MAQRVRITKSLFIIPITLYNPSNKSSIWVRALLDTGCSRDLFNPILVTGLGLPVQILQEPIIFKQMDVSPMKGELCSLSTASTSVGMGHHWELRSFIVGPTAKFPVVLGFRWLLDHELLIRWSQRLLTFQEPSFTNHQWGLAWGPPPNLNTELAALS